jgi:peptidoglycan/xylan/chitin deacetylase (PgdA/CDA1 family)
MSKDKKILELSVSKQKLESEFKQPVITYAYTYGDTNKECAELAEICGYEYALNTDTGGLLLEEEPYAIFRVNIFPDESFSSLWKKTRKWYRRYYFYKRNK